ncbi:hypothetical protein MKX03_037032 [Papaver bracteatum]|nr:hypothetical protein MKX03_037032 [Papaver bracteatum]
MAETTATRDQVSLEIRCSPKSIIKSTKQWDESFQEQTISFLNFCSRRKKKSNTWIISLFVVLHLVVFATTMIVNDCPRNSSHGRCVIRSIGRVSFQPLTENPFLGPSSSTLDEMGALRRKLLVKHEIWRLVTSPWLHAGMFSLIINLSGVIFIGLQLEREFGSLRIGMIYLCSGFTGSLMSALFVQDIPEVGSSGALFGLLGAMLSGLIRNWKFYSDKFTALVVLCLAATINFSLGVLPHVDNFSNVGGFVSGFLLGFVLFFDPRLLQVPQNKKGLFEYKEKRSMNFKQKLDKPVLRSISLVLFALLVAGGIVAVLHGENLNNQCSWCHYVNCIPSKRWSCNVKASLPCEVRKTANQSILTCKSNGKSRVYTFTNLSEARIRDLCSEICY